ncbi:hypothetical protein QJS04_geneDACA005019 [Acorus gramineus]|uniref:Transmembrane protein n=1 Tax=Acorus gramineus TaxID=55184 RepID=A0AAV9AYN1_ACOGR|nr:hypothetical protein QJS04_geneDACA005019 [Acorus gramineus]
MSALQQSPPLVVYPHSVSTTPTLHSRGSFGPVFAALAVITVLSALACFLGRFCAHRISRLKFGRDRNPRVKSDPEDRINATIHRNGRATEARPVEKSETKNTGNGEAKPAEKGETKHVENGEAQTSM